MCNAVGGGEIPVDAARKVLTLAAMRMGMRAYLAFGLLGLFLAFCLVSAPALATDGLTDGSTDAPADTRRERWFQPGERFDYNVRWGIFDVGSAAIEVLDPREVGGVMARGFSMTARTNDFADIFYRVRDRNESWTDMDMQSSLLYVTAQHEGSYHRDFELRFFAQNGTAELWSRETGLHKNTLAIFPGTVDPLAVLFIFRAWPGDFREGMVIRQAVTDGKKFVLGEARIVRRETVKVPLGEFDCFLVEPDIKDLGGVFQKSPEAALQIWVTADERRLPVLVRSKVLVGYFRAELASYRE